MGILTKFLESEREKKIKPYIKGFVLDIGCGPATAINYKEVKKYIGIELNEKDVFRLKRKYPKASFYSKNMESDEIKLKGKVDVVVMCAFIEHIKNYENPLRESIKNLKEGSRIVITTPTKFGNFVHFIGASIGLFSKEARDDHVTILSKNDFLRIANEYNLKLIKYEYFEFLCNQLGVFEK